MDRHLETLLQNSRRTPEDAEAWEPTLRAWLQVGRGVEARLQLQGMYARSPGAPSHQAAYLRLLRTRLGIIGDPRWQFPEGLHGLVGGPDCDWFAAVLGDRIAFFEGHSGAYVASTACEKTPHASRAEADALWIVDDLSGRLGWRIRKLEAPSAALSQVTEVFRDEEESLLAFGLHPTRLLLLSEERIRVLELTSAFEHPWVSSAALPSLLESTASPDALPHTTALAGSHLLLTQGNVLRCEGIAGLLWTHKLEVAIDHITVSPAGTSVSVQINRGRGVVLEIFEVGTGARLAHASLGRHSYLTPFYLTEDIVAAGREDEVITLDLETGRLCELTREFPVRRRRLWSASFTGGLALGHRGQIWPCDKQGAVLGNPDLGGAAPVQSVHTGPDSRVVASQDEDQGLNFWDLDTGASLRHFRLKDFEPATGAPAHKPLSVLLYGKRRALMIRGASWWTLNLEAADSPLEMPKTAYEGSVAEYGITPFTVTSGNAHLLFSPHLSRVVRSDFSGTILWEEELGPSRLRAITQTRTGDFLAYSDEERIRISPEGVRLESVSFAGLGHRAWLQAWALPGLDADLLLRAQQLLLLPHDSDNPSVLVPGGVQRATSSSVPGAPTWIAAAKKNRIEIIKVGTNEDPEFIPWRDARGLAITSGARHVIVPQLRHLRVLERASDGTRL